MVEGGKEGDDLTEGRKGRDGTGSGRGMGPCGCGWGREA